MKIIDTIILSTFVCFFVVIIKSSNLNFTSIDDECFLIDCDGNRCDYYPLTDESTLNILHDVCPQLKYSNCNDINDLIWITNQTVTANACINECPYCKCTQQNDTSFQNQPNINYYLDSNVYHKTCYECKCINHHKNCSVVDTVSINEENWNTFKCDNSLQNKKNNITQCLSSSGDSNEQCTNQNNNYCTIESNFQWNCMFYHLLCSTNIQYIPLTLHQLLFFVCVVLPFFPNYSLQMKLI